MIRVTIGRDLVVRERDLPQGALGRIRRAFTYKNEEWQRRTDAGHPQGPLRPTFRTFSHDEERGEVRVARGATRELEEAIGAPVEWVDETVVSPAEWPEYLGELWPFQDRAARVASASVQGVILGPCGSGKTEVMLAAAARTGQRTLVAVDTKDLQRQWADRFRLRFDSRPGDLGIVGGLETEPDYDWEWAVRGAPGRVLTVATVQTLRSRPEVLDAHGCLAADEVHLWAAPTFEDAASASPSRHRIGGTATLRRADGMVKVITDTFGPVLYEITAEELEDAGRRVPVSVHLVRTAFKFDMKPRWRGGRVRTAGWDEVLDAMTHDAERHACVMGAVDRALREGPTVVLSERRGYGFRIAHELSLRGVRAHTLFGGAGKVCDCVRCGYVPPEEAAEGKRCPRCSAPRLSRSEHNADVLRLVDAGTVRVVVGTSVADKGLDSPRLSRAVVALPSSGGRGKPVSARMIQQVGRLSRPAEGKDDACLYYVHDEKMGFARDREKAMRKEFERLT